MLARINIIGSALRSFWNSSADEKVTSVVSFALPMVAGGAAGAAGGAAAGVETTLSELPILANAQNAAESLAANTSSATAMVGAAYDIETGAIAAGKSGGIEGVVNPQVADRAAPLGGIGAQVPGVNGKVGNCFECSTANDLANQGSDLENVRHTQGIRPRNLKQFDKCPNCKEMFPEGQP